MGTYPARYTNPETSARPAINNNQFTIVSLMNLVSSNTQYYTVTFHVTQVVLRILSPYFVSRNMEISR